MSSTVIKVENLSKLYRLGEVGTGTLSHDLNRWMAKVRGKEDPFAKVGQLNDRTKKAEGDYVWSLKDINFEVKQGEVLGIIGKNGAGKSTLLKLLSQITAPTTGEIKIKGRIAALLEVGTGMHPQMTARENIYLNGAIMGMRKHEIRAKFDEIVEFSGCALYVDTPIKRFSSGMRVRLGFAVAAFLEPEILIVDEVLAVGDAEFQKKAIGKMKDVSTSDGRTVLFVSHNMVAVKSFCSRTIFLENGHVAKDGKTDEIVDYYLKNQETIGNTIFDEGDEKVNNGNIRLIEIKKVSSLSGGQFYIDEKFEIKVSFENKSITTPINVNLFFNKVDGECIFATTSEKKELQFGKCVSTCFIPANQLNNDLYSIDIQIATVGRSAIYFKEAIVIEGVESQRERGWMGKFPGLIRPKYDWELNNFVE